MKLSDILEENRRFWEECFVGADLDFESSPGEDILEIIRRLQEHQVSEVLDLGCGFGRWSIAFARAGFQVKAVDISSEAIRRVRKWADKEGFSIEIDVCSAQEITFSSGSFDAVICNSVLDHMPVVEASKALDNIENVLKPDGVAYISFDGLEDDDPREYTILDDETRRYISGKRKGMLWRFYSDEEIKTLCKNMEMIDFIVRGDGKRNVWVRKKKAASANTPLTHRCA